MTSYTSPDIRNYYIGKGIIYFQGPSDPDYVDLGNCPKFEFDPKNTNLAHYSARLGTKFKDNQVITVKEPEVMITLDEWTQDNLARVLIGTNNAGTVNVFDQHGVTGAIKFVGTNDVGPKKQIILPTVFIMPTGKLSLIEDGYGQIELMGAVLGDPTTGIFGTIVDI